MAKFHYHHYHRLWLVTTYILSKSPSLCFLVTVPQFPYAFLTLESEQLPERRKVLYRLQVQARGQSAGWTSCFLRLVLGSPHLKCVGVEMLTAT